MPAPYVMIQNLVNDNSPNRYTQLVARGLAGVINDDYRYVMRFTKNFTLRDKLEENYNSPMLKDTHTEWELFREKQQYNITSALWNKVVEAMIGYKLDDSTVRVPSIERELYDEVYGTDTRYGLRDGQIFVDGDLAITAIVTDLQNPDNSFYPIDIDAFFETYSFDTPENIIAAMNAIYTSFPYEHVNRMFFSVLMDALTKKAKYPDLFKTSMVSLHGIKILETAGLFDE